MWIHIILLLYTCYDFRQIATYSLHRDEIGEEIEEQILSSEVNTVSKSNSNRNFKRSLALISFPECYPLLPTPNKVFTLSEFRHENTPLVFWHVQKSGGTYFSELYDDEYERRGYKRHRNGYYQHFGPDALDIDIWRKSYRPKEYFALFVEPGNRDGDSFPLQYRTYPATQILLNKEKSGKKYKHAWNNYIHVMTIRKPLDLAMSAFRYRFWELDESIIDVCEQHKLRANDCLEELFRIKEHEKHTIAKYFNQQQKNRIREELFGNFSINHLSLTGDLEEARKRLSRFHLIVDLSYEKESDYLISCVLGWKINHDVRANKNKAVKAKDVWSELKNETITRWSEYLRYEQELYGKTSESSLINDELITCFVQIMR
jgi:hypothetical protein